MSSSLVFPVALPRKSDNASLHNACAKQSGVSRSEPLFVEGDAGLMSVAEMADAKVSQASGH
jgi:hypothetical protein